MKTAIHDAIQKKLKDIHRVQKNIGTLFQQNQDNFYQKIDTTHKEEKNSVYLQDGFFSVENQQGKKFFVNAGTLYKHDHQICLRIDDEQFKSLGHLKIQGMDSAPMDTQHFFVDQGSNIIASDEQGNETNLGTLTCYHNSIPFESCHSKNLIFTIPKNQEVEDLVPMSSKKIEASLKNGIQEEDYSTSNITNTLELQKTCQLIKGIFLISKNIRDISEIANNQAVTSGT